MTSQEAKFFAAAEQPKTTSSLGIAGLVLGGLALVICWVPFLGILSIPVSVIGGILALVGLGLALAKKETGAGIPAAATLLCGVTFVLPIWSTGKVVSDLQDSRAKARESVVRQTIVSDPVETSSNKRPETTEDAPVNQQTIEDWIPSTKAVTQGNIQVTITGIRCGSVECKSPFGQSASQKDKYLLVTVRLQNVSTNKKVDYKTWNGEMIQFGNAFATLEDNSGNVYKRIGFPFGMEPIGQVRSESIYPGKEVSDLLVFEPPIEGNGPLKLSLPAANFSGQGTIKYQISETQITRR
jgi:hypothetical protein